MTDPDDLRTLFDVLVELSPTEREERLEQLRTHDPEGAARLERLLRADAEAAPRLAAADRLRSTLLAEGGVSGFQGAEGEGPVRAGEQVGPYRVERLLGTGGMGAVYRARDDRLGREVALKFLRPSWWADEGLLREARAASALDHPHICTLLEVGSHPGAGPFLVMPFYPGETLAEILQRGALPVREVARIGAQIARGLDHAHRRGILHRDIKPSNLLLTSEGVVKILDFGVAKTPDSGSTAKGAALGTVAWMPPERLRGEPADARGDLWSLGAVLHSLLTGRPLFERPDVAVSLHRVLHGEIPEPISPLEPVPERLSRLVSSLLERDPTGRPASAAEVAGVLEEVAGGTATPGAGPAGSRTRWWWRFRRAAMGGGAILAVLAIGFGWMAWGPRGGAAALPAEGRIVLVGDLASRSGDTLVAAAVTEALRVDVDRSPLARSLERTRVIAALGRMGLPPGTPLRDEVAREVALREGVDLVLEGEVNRVGREWVMVASLVDPLDGIRIATSRETAPGEEGVLAAVDRLSLVLREGLGESARRLRGQTPLERVTTRSLEALQLYARALRALEIEGAVGTAGSLLAEAIRLDPDFALAHRRLGVLDWLGNGRSRVSLAEAYRLRERLPPEERLEVTATYLTEFPGDQEGARYALVELIERNPEHPRARGNLALVLHRAGRPAEAVRILESIDPSTRHPWEWFGLFAGLLVVGRQQEAMALIREGERRFPGNWLFLGYEWGGRVLAGELVVADSLLEVMLDRYALDGASETLVLRTAVHGKVRQGRLDEAEALIERARRRAALSPELGFQEGYAVAQGARIALELRGDAAGAIAAIDAFLEGGRMESFHPLDRPLAKFAEILALAGEPVRARALLERGLEDTLGYRRERQEWSVARAAIELVEGRPVAAVELLDTSIPGFECVTCGEALLGRALRASGRPVEAAAAYRRLVDSADLSAALDWDALLVPVALAELAEALVEAGELEGARDAWQRLLALWEGGDPAARGRLSGLRERLGALDSGEGGSLAGVMSDPGA